uniref:Solute carrier organic anion transporter family member n=1 Tax=Parascaris univalens TaxID=6257 RepID=A0A914ZJ48_PARUN
MEGRKAVICFFVLFLTVYFLEAIGGFYMTSAVVSIEKQFQIPSRMSGLMVSAGDFGYIPSVVFVSYLGGKGNRARWIGGGCLMIALANFLISMSNFLFPVESIRLNGSVVEQRIEIDSERLSDDTTAESFFEYISKSIAATNFTDMIEVELPANLRNISMKKFAQKKLDFCYPKNESMNICNRYYDYLREVKAPTASDIANIRILMGAPFAFCSRLVNSLRDQIEYLKCSKDPSNLGPFIMIFGGLLILGVGRTMPFSLGLPLIDDNVKRKNLPVYFAGMFFIRILGPVLGFMIGGITNRYYYSFEVPPGLSPRDPMWIGRWWAGFLGISVVMFGPSLALYLFPTPSKKKAVGETAELENGDGVKISLKAEMGVEQQPLQKAKPTHKRNRSLALVDRNVTRDKDGNTVVPKNFDEKVNDFISTVKTIIRAPVYTGALIGRILDVFAFKGFFIFLPKYLEVQFGLPQHVISFYMGIVGVSGFAMGVLIGSVAMRKFKLQGRKAAAFVAVCSTMAAILSFLNAAVGCKSVLSHLADYSVANNGLFNSTCNEGCNCDGMPLYPVCNQLGEVFYSPCQAGCPLDETLATDSPHKIFKKCVCSNTTDMLVSRDFCRESVCESKFVMYFINMAISGVFGGMGVIPAILIILRSVPPIDRSISLGFQGFLVSLFATLPSPVVWGWIVDSACIRWNNVCGDPIRGACSIYDTDRLRLRTHITYGIMRLVSLISDVWVFVFAKDLILIDEEPVRDENGKEEEMQEITSDCIVDKDRKFSM